MSVGGFPATSLPETLPIVGATAPTGGPTARGWEGIRRVWAPPARAAVTYHSICVGFAGTDSPFTLTLTLKLAEPPAGTVTSETVSPAAFVKLTETPAGTLRTALELSR